MVIDYYLDQRLDQLGRPEEFTRDAYLILPRGITSHLDENGLPVVGTEICPGTLLIAKFGATKSYNREAMPMDLEQWTESEDALMARYNHMFYDASFYAPDGVYGKVIQAYFEPIGKFQRAVVRIDTSEL